MRTTIDGAGRVVIPKALRERMGWKGEAEVDVYEAPDGTRRAVTRRWNP